VPVARPVELADPDLGKYGKEEEDMVRKLGVIYAVERFRQKRARDGTCWEGLGRVWLTHFDVH
jgi:hypothetical protein